MVAGTLCLASLFLNTPSAAAQTRPNRLVRIAELEIDPGQLEAYKNALREEIEASIGIEPGVLTLYAVAVKNQPNQIRLFEVYAGTAASSIRTLPEVQTPYRTHGEVPKVDRNRTGFAGH